MATSYTSFLGLALPATGELSGTWGDTVNNYISTYLDSAIAGAVTLTADTTLTKTTGSSLGATSSQYAIIIASPASANITITAPAASKAYLINNTSGTYTVTIRGAGPTTGVTLLASEKALVAWNGSDFVKIASTSATVINSGLLAVSYGGTGVTSSTGSGSNVLSTSPTLVTPFLGTPQSGNFSTGTFTWPTFNQNTSGTAAGLSATLAVSSGGTGLSSTPANGALDIGNGSGFTRTTLTPGTGISITNASGAITITNTSTSSGGTVTSVGGTGTINGITLSGTVTSSGNLTLGGTLSGVSLTTQVSGTLPIANGGTGSTSTTFVSLTSNVTGTLPVANGGTGSTSTTFVNLASNVTGTLPVGNGGTGATTLAGANIPVTNAANTFSATQTFNGTSSTFASVLLNAAETTTVSATAATGTINYYVNSQSVLYYTSNASANWTLNVAFSAGTSLNSSLATGQTVTIAFMVTQGATAYYASAFTIDGTSVTPKWQGGTAPTSGNASSIDVYTYTITKTASATYTVLASQTKFA
jgi:hypothetical protein